MIRLTVRCAHKNDETLRNEIVRINTQELCKIYGPIEKNGQYSRTQSSILFTIVSGTAEYTRKEDHVFVQWVAVHPNYRRIGVCRDLATSISAAKNNERQ